MPSGRGMQDTIAEGYESRRIRTQMTKEKADKKAEVLVILIARQPLLRRLVGFWVALSFVRSFDVLRAGRRC